MDSLEALRRINGIATGFFASQTFFAACELGVFSHLSGKGLQPAELASSVALPVEGTRRLLVALEALGLVRRSEGSFLNSELGSHLLPDAKPSLAPLSMRGKPFYRMWEYLIDALRDLSPRWEQALGTTTSETFQELYADPERLRRFLSLMDAYSIPIARVVADSHDFGKHQRILDVAGGAGGFSLEIGARHPHIRGQIMDLANVCRVADDHIASRGMQRRFDTVECDLFADQYPEGADVIILSWVLHDWGDAKCRVILGNCYGALRPGGVVLISESVVNASNHGDPFAALMSLHMTVVCESGAKERTLDEYQSLLDGAGFEYSSCDRFGGPRDLIVACHP